MRSILTKEHKGETCLVSGDLGLDVVLKGTVALVLVCDEGAELLRELLKVVQVVDTKTRAGGLGRVGWANSLTGGSNANQVKGIDKREAGDVCE